MLGFRRQEGFTLPELMAVIVIIVLILVIAIPLVGDTTTRATDATAEVDAKMFEKAAQVAETDGLEMRSGGNLGMGYYLVGDLIDGGYVDFDDESIHNNTVDKNEHMGFTYMADGEVGNKDDAPLTPESDFEVMTVKSYIDNNFPGDGSGDSIAHLYLDMYDNKLSQEQEYDDFNYGEYFVYTASMFFSEGLSLDDVILMDYKGTSSSITLPSHIDGNPVVKVHRDVVDGINDVYFDSGYSEIYDGFFMVEDIASNNMWGSTEPVDHDVSLHLHKGIKKVGVASFINFGFKEIIFEGSMNSIGHYAFAIEDTFSGYPGSKRMDALILPEGLNTVEYGSFYGVVFDKLVLPDSVESIADMAFGHGYRENITPDMVSYSKDLLLPNNLKSIGEASFANIGLSGELDLKGVNSIGSYAFGNNKLSRVTLPDYSADVNIRRDAFIGNNELLFENTAGYNLSDFDR